MIQPYKKNEITMEEIVPLAERMRKNGVMLVMIHGYVDKEGAFVLSYEYAIGGGIESYQLKTTQKSLPSISSIYDTAAAWPEKELEELMGLHFEGLDMQGRLFLPDNMLDGDGQILVTPLSELREKREAQWEAEKEKKADEA